jgi:hypothetical protein
MKTDKYGRVIGTKTLEEEMKDLYNSKNKPILESLRTRVCLYLFFKGFETTSGFIYKKLYDECCLAKAIYNGDNKWDRKFLEYLDKQIELENMDLYKLSPNLHTEICSDKVDVVLINPPIVVFNLGNTGNSLNGHTAG